MAGKVTKIVGAWLGVSPKKETPFIKLQCELESSEDLYHTMYLTEKTKDNTFASLRLYGYAPDEISVIGDSPDGASAAAAYFEPLNAPVDVVVVNEAYTNDKGERKEITKIECIAGMGFAQAKLQDKDKPKFHRFDLMYKATKKQGGGIEDSFDDKEQIPF